MCMLQVKLHLGKVMCLLLHGLWGFRHVRETRNKRCDHSTFHGMGEAFPTNLRQQMFCRSILTTWVTSSWCGNVWAWWLDSFHQTMMWLELSCSTSVLAGIPRMFPDVPGLWNMISGWPRSRRHPLGIMGYVFQYLHQKIATAALLTVKNSQMNMFKALWTSGGLAVLPGREKHIIIWLKTGHCWNEEPIRIQHKCQKQLLPRKLTCPLKNRKRNPSFWKSSPLF